jgi:hypothetical protein
MIVVTPPAAAASPAERKLSRWRSPGSPILTPQSTMPGARHLPPQSITVGPFRRLGPGPAAMDHAIGDRQAAGRVGSGLGVDQAGVGEMQDHGTFRLRGRGLHSLRGARLSIAALSRRGGGSGTTRPGRSRRGWASRSAPTPPAAPPERQGSAACAPGAGREGAGAGRGSGAARAAGSGAAGPGRDGGSGRNTGGPSGGGVAGPVMPCPRPRGCARRWRRGRPGTSSGACRLFG